MTPTGPSPFVSLPRSISPASRPVKELSSLVFGLSSPTPDPKPVPPRVSLPILKTGDPLPPPNPYSQTQSFRRALDATPPAVLAFPPSQKRIPVADSSRRGPNDSK